MTDQQLGRYRLLGVLGKGAMGIVYEAFDPHLDRRVAIKTMRLSDMASTQAMSFEGRFLTEARSAARLRHPAIVSVFDWGRDDDVTYLVMEKVKGVNLRQCLDKGIRFSASGVVAIMRPVLAALAHAHDQKVVHRDIKPENILLDASGALKLTDFGIAKIQDGDDNGTLISGLVIGTPRYMSPEQVQGKEIDSRSDLFSAGVLLYELLTGRPPFNGEHAMAVISAILSSTPPPLADRAVVLSPAWDALIAKALTKGVDGRFQNAAAFRLALDEVAANEPSLAQHAEAGGSQPLHAWLQPGSAPALDGLFAGLAQFPSEPSLDMTASAPARHDDVQPSAHEPRQQPLKRVTRQRVLWASLAACGMVGVVVWLKLTATASVPAVPAQAPLSAPAPAPAPAPVPVPVPVPVPAKERVNPDAPPPQAVPNLADSGKPSVQAKPPVAPPAGMSAPVAKPAEPMSAMAGVKPANVKGAAVLVPGTSAAQTCSRLLEKASSGEPLSASDQKEMVSSCR